MKSIKPPALHFRNVIQQVKTQKIYQLGWDTLTGPAHLQVTCLSSHKYTYLQNKQEMQTLILKVFEQQMCSSV